MKKLLFLILFSLITTSSFAGFQLVDEGGNITFEWIFFN